MKIDSKRKANAMPGLDSKIATEFHDLERYAADWTRLQNVGERQDIFQDFKWIDAWWQTLGQRCRLFTPIAFRDGRVVAILPLVLDGRELKFLGYNVSDYNNFLAESDEAHKALEACLEALDAQNQYWDQIRVENIPQASLMADCLQRLPTRWRHRMVAGPGDGCPTMLLKDDKAGTLKARKSKLKSVVKRLARDGQLDFRHIERKEEVDGHLRQFFRQHIERSAIAGRRSNFLDKDYVAFYTALLRRFETSGNVRFSVLEVNGHPVSYHFGFQYAGKYLFYKPTFDVDYWDLSPGQALLAYVFEYLDASDVQEFDFGRGDESYKQRFSNHVRQNVNFTIYGASYRSKWRMVIAQAGDMFKAALKRSPHLEQAARKIQTVGQELRASRARFGVWPAFRKLLWDPIFVKEEFWAVAWEPKDRERVDQDPVSVRKASLAELAYRSVDMPKVLTDRELLAARNLIRQKMTPWIVSKGPSVQAVVWTMVDTLGRYSGGAIPHGEDVMLAAEIWPFPGGDPAINVLSVLPHLIPTAEAMNLTLWGILPSRLMPSRKMVLRQGANRMYRLVRMCVFGRCSTVWQAYR